MYIRFIRFKTKHTGYTTKHCEIGFGNENILSTPLTGRCERFVEGGRRVTRLRLVGKTRLSFTTTFSEFATRARNPCRRPPRSVDLTDGIPDGSFPFPSVPTPRTARAFGNIYHFRNCYRSRYRSVIVVSRFPDRALHVSRLERSFRNRPPSARPIYCQPDRAAATRPAPPS